MQTIDQILRQSGLPRLEARLLLEKATGWTHAQLVTRGDDRPSEKQLAAWEQLLARRLAGEPIAYILGEREFFGRSFKVNPATLIPRPETEHLVEAVLQRLPPHGKVWDLGVGSGTVAVSVACERPDAEVSASDISAEALSVAAENAAALGAVVRFAQGSWFDIDALAKPAYYDVVVSNPPYIEADDEHLSAGDLRFEPAGALTDFADGLSAIRVLVAGAQRYLQAGGWLMLEHGYRQGAAVRALFEKYGWQQVETLPDLAGLDRLIIGQKVK